MNDELDPQVPDYPDSINIMWTTIDVVRFADPEEEPGSSAFVLV